MQHLKNTKKPGEFEKSINNDDKTNLCLELKTLITYLRTLNLIVRIGYLSSILNGLNIIFE